MKIFLSGGGTLGPVVPLLAIAEVYKKSHPEAEFVWVGTRRGPEKTLVSEYDIPFFTITAGKMRRYFSLLNIFDLIRIASAFFQSLLLLWQEKPVLLISAGGFVSVPLHWAGALLGIPAWVHQQDAVPGLSNKLMVRFAKKITTALQESVKYFPKHKTEWIGNPVRDLSVVDINTSRTRFNIHDDSPVIFALGGGTGSAKINQMVVEAVPHFPHDWHVIHLVGRERPKELATRAAGAFPNYQVFDFFTDEMKDAYAIASVVIGRAGFGTLTELAALGKPAIIIPMMDTHQEVNAKYLAKLNAIVMLDGNATNGLELAKEVKELIKNREFSYLISRRLHEVLPPAKEDKIVGIMDELVSEI